jgi:NitT/TauT family transport system permease protein
MAATDVVAPHDAVRPKPTRVRRHPSDGFLARCATPRAPMRPLEALVASLIVWTLFVAGWAIITYGGFVRAIFLPTPDAMVTRAVSMWADGSLVGHAGASLVVVLVGFTLSSILAVPLGLMAGTYSVFQACIGPFVGFTRYLPVTAFVPLFILWIGIGLEQQAAVIFFGVFFQQMVMVADLVRSVPDDLVSAAYTLGTPKRKALPNVILPAVAPGILDMLRITIAWAWTYLVVAEMVGANQGLGYISIKAMRGFQVDTIFLAIAIIGLFGLGTDMGLRFLRDRLFPWAK